MTPAVTAAKRAGIAYELHEYDHDPRTESYGLEAVEALNQAPEQVFKTLVAQVDQKQLVVAIVPVVSMLDLKAVAKVAKGRKATMAQATDAQRATGYLVGGISPLGQKKKLLTIVDESANRYERVFVSAGRRGLEIELAPADLAKVCQATFAAIAAS